MVMVEVVEAIMLRTVLAQGGSIHAYVPNSQHFITLLAVRVEFGALIRGRKLSGC